MWAPPKYNKPFRRSAGCDRNLVFPPANQGGALPAHQPPRGFGFGPSNSPPSGEKAGPPPGTASTNHPLRPAKFPPRRSSSNRPTAVVRSSRVLTCSIHRTVLRSSSAFSASLSSCPLSIFLLLLPPGETSAVSSARCAVDGCEASLAADDRVGVEGCGAGSGAGGVEGGGFWRPLSWRPAWPLPAAARRPSVPSKASAALL